MDMWRVGRVAMQRIANPWTSVRFRDAPPLSLLSEKIEKSGNLRDRIVMM